MSNKILDRYNKQTGRNTSHLKIENDPVDNYINAHLKAREQLQQYQEQKQKQEAEEQQKQELEKIMQKQVIKQIQDILKNLFD